MTRRSALWWSAVALIANFVYAVQSYGGEPLGHVMSGVSFAVLLVSVLVCWVCSVVLTLRYLAVRGPTIWSMALIVVAVLLVPPLSTLLVLFVCRHSTPPPTTSGTPPA